MSQHDPISSPVTIKLICAAEWKSRGILKTKVQVFRISDGIRTCKSFINRQRETQISNVQSPIIIDKLKITDRHHTKSWLTSCKMKLGSTKIKKTAYP